VPFAQLPAASLGILAVTGLAQLLRISASRAFGAGLLWISTPVLLRQVSEAGNDLWIGAWLLTSVFFALRFARTHRSAYFFFSIMSASLAVGTKFLGIVYLPIVTLVWILVQRWNRSAGSSVRPRHFLVGSALAVLVGGFVYIRNIATCGNPLSPLRGSIAGHEILPGFVDSDFFFESAEMTLGFSELFVSVRAFADGGVGFLAAIVGIVIAARVLLSRPEHEERIAAVAALASTIAFFFFVPYRYHRFAAFPLGLTLPFFVRRAPPPVFLGAIFVNLAGASLYLGKEMILGPRTITWTPWSTVLVLMIIATAGLGFALTRVRRSKGFATPAWLVAGVAALLTIAALEPGYEERRFDAWKLRWSHERVRAKGFAIQADRADWANCWARVAEYTGDRPSKVAYAGSNLPYPLRGKRLRNEVFAVPPTTDCEDSYFDWGNDMFNPTSDLDSTAWLRRIWERGADLLCIFREEGKQWTPELEWAAARPADFEPLWRSDHAALFAVRPSEGAVP
jgi:hypothetical protein